MKNALNRQLTRGGIYYHYCIMPNDEKPHRHKFRIKRMQTNKRNKRLVDWQHVVSYYYAVNKIGFCFFGLPINVMNRGPLGFR